MDASRQPTPDEIEDRFAAIAEGRLARDEVDRRAGRRATEVSIVPATGR
ncbi:hypothetical protein [Streptomyces globosus]|nr:hypothetical protein [Streptomyces globosus]